MLLKTNREKVYRISKAIRIGRVQICVGGCESVASGAYAENYFSRPFIDNNVFVFTVPNQSGYYRRVGVVRDVYADRFEWQVYNDTNDRYVRGGRYIAIGFWK